MPDRVRLAYHPLGSHAPGQYLNTGGRAALAPGLTFLLSWPSAASLPGLAIPPTAVLSTDALLRTFPSPRGRPSHAA